MGFRCSKTTFEKELTDKKRRAIISRGAAMAGATARNRRRSEKLPLTVELPAPVFRLLEEAAARRTGAPSVGKRMSAAELGSQIIAGVICRGSIDETVNKCPGAFR